MDIYVKRVYIYMLLVLSCQFAKRVATVTIPPTFVSLGISTRVVVLLLPLTYVCITYVEYNNNNKDFY